MKQFPTVALVVLLAGSAASGAVTAQSNAAGREAVRQPKEVVVFDVRNQTASAKVTAMWGVDYMHLAKHEGRWKILNIVWQEPAK